MRSTKRIVPLEYMKNVDNSQFIQEIGNYIRSKKINTSSAMYSLGVNLLKKNELLGKKHVAETLLEYSDNVIDQYLSTLPLPDDEFDILGLIYQTSLDEGEKNLMGSYYTPKEVVENMVQNFSFSEGEIFLDPCCGSGIFLLTLQAQNPAQLFGIDVDPIAVMIAKINLLIKYPNVEFIPQIYNWDFFSGPCLNKNFDYVATNPPWGSKNDKFGKDSFSLFFVKASTLLKQKGIIKFLFPESILNVKNHSDIRKFILENGLKNISLYEGSFSGVTTKYVDIECNPSGNNENFTVCKGERKQLVPKHTIYETENCVFNFLTEEDVSVIKAVKSKGSYTLGKSLWGLGIVTGDNKGKLFEEFSPGMEKIYTGKEIQPYTLKPAKNYILYDRAKLQQVAREEIYRASEKLAYKFISKKLVFSYDNSGGLFLNSANILIPSIPGMSVKSVLAFLNSSLFQFMYLKLFGEVKILKGNLMELPFPRISNADNDRLIALVDKVLEGDFSKMEEIEQVIFSIYSFDNKQINYIKDVVNGKAG